MTPHLRLPDLVFFGLIALTLFGLSWCIIQPVDMPPLRPVIEPTPAVLQNQMGSRLPAIEQILAINAQAGAIAGYPAIVEPEQRQAAARQAARQITQLVAQAQHIEAGEGAGKFVQRQIDALNQIHAALNAYADGNGSDALRAASAANAALHTEMESISIGDAPNTTH